MRAGRPPAVPPLPSLPQNSLHAAEQCFTAHRLAQRHSRTQPFRDVRLFSRHLRNRDDLYLRVNFSKLRHRLQILRFRHPQIRNHQIDARGLLYHRDRLPAVRRLQHREAVAGQVTA